MADNSLRRPYTFDRVVRIFFSICGLALALFVIDMLQGVLLPFLVACLIAYILEPVVGWNKKLLHTKKRFLPVVMTLLEAAVLGAVFCLVVVPYLIDEVSDMADIVKKYASTQLKIPFLSEDIHKFLRENIDWNAVGRMLSRDEWVELGKKAISSSWSFLSSGIALIAGILSWLIVVLYVIFIMLDYERLMLSFRQLVPYQYRHRVFKVTRDVKNAMNRYFRGQFIVSMLVGILFCIGFVIIKLPMAVAFGLFIGILNMVPYLQLISLPLCALLCVVGSVSMGTPFWGLFWEAMAVYVVVQCIQDLYLTPRIMGKVMGLNPAIILLSLSVWGSLLGFIGLIIALPLTTLLLSYYDQYIVNRHKKETDSHLILPDDFKDKE